MRYISRLQLNDSHGGTKPYQLFMSPARYAVPIEAGLRVTVRWPSIIFKQTSPNIDSSPS